MAKWQIVKEIDHVFASVGGGTTDIADPDFSVAVNGYIQSKIDGCYGANLIQSPNND